MKIPSIMEMLQAGVHFGHQVSRWHPKMEKYIFTERNGVHVLHLEETRKQLEEVLPQIKQMAAEGKQILFVTTKPQALDIVKQAAESCGAPFLVGRWLGGLLTNFPEMRKLINSYKKLKGEQASGELERYTKKEQVDIAKKLEKMDKMLAGLVTVDKLPDAVFIPALQREKTSVTEARAMNVPVIAICDTNSNPEKADYVIPANDDAVNSITMIVNLVAEAIKEGKVEFEKRQKENKMAAAPVQTPARHKDVAVASQ
jgi:small subunit ribosomal protein S2